ncbi:hypothetical protein [Kineosporia succinea]|uniref:Uncharacterized protein n=1 Tax=Kineosporia succinea TaxID=84632 RepID=A0ABT9P655_9ACTN|nr:hypothetical protein [Kineosporia succinea]MDP9827555.1 hypothetical protein [Kineosporia succinea]
MALRFNPAPGWPTPPEGFDPPPDWIPDPGWPAAPEGWTFWVDDEADAAPAAPVIYWSNDAPPIAPENPGPSSPSAEASRPAGQVFWSQPAPAPPSDINGTPPSSSTADRRQAPSPTGPLRRSQAIALAGTLAVMLGSVVPFADYDTVFLYGLDLEMRVTPLATPSALAVSFVYGLALTALVVASRRAHLRSPACIGLLVTALLGFGGYLLYTMIGLTSGYEPGGLYGTQIVHWSPGPGVALCILGTAVAAFQSVIILREPS